LKESKCSAGNYLLDRADLEDMVGSFVHVLGADDDMIDSGTMVTHCDYLTGRCSDFWKMLSHARFLIMLTLICSIVFYFYACLFAIDVSNLEGDFPRTGLGYF
jgi:hypothetical protein